TLDYRSGGTGCKDSAASDFDDLVRLHSWCAAARLRYRGRIEESKFGGNNSVRRYDCIDRVEFVLYSCALRGCEIDAGTRESSRGAGRTRFVVLTQLQHYAP